MRHALIGLLLATLAAGSAYALEKREDAAGDLTRDQAQAVATRMFDQLDVNKDGKIDGADRDARRSELFDRLDTNHDGQLSRSEFTAAGTSAARDAGPKDAAPAKQAARPRAGAPTTRVDTDHSGGVTQAEYIAVALRRFDAADANKDGRLTPAERRAQAPRRAPAGQPSPG